MGITCTFSLPWAWGLLLLHQGDNFVKCAMHLITLTKRALLKFFKEVTLVGVKNKIHKTTLILYYSGMQVNQMVVF